MITTRILTYITKKKKSQVMVIHQETPNTGKLFQSGIIPTLEVFAFLLWALVSQPATCHLLPFFCFPLRLSQNDLKCTICSRL